MEDFSKEDMMNKKDDTLQKVQQRIVHLDSATATLENLVIEKNKSIKNKQVQVESLLKDIDEDCKERDQANKKISENISITRQLQARVESLQRATTKIKINKECSELLDKVAHLPIKDITEILFKNPKQALKKMQNTNQEIYAIDGAGIERASKLQVINGTLQLGSLRKDIRPTANATLIPLTSLLSVVSTRPIVYLDLEAHGRPLGRVRILLTYEPKRREQMLRLCTALAGDTYRGSYFDEAWKVGDPGEHIICKGYMTANGDRDNRQIVQNLEQVQCQAYIAGTVSGVPSNTNFWICTRDSTTLTPMLPELGRVVSGLDMLSQAIQQSTEPRKGYYQPNDASQIKISETGIELSN